MILDYLGGSSVVTRVLIRGSWKGQNQKRRYDSRNIGHSDAIGGIEP